MSSGNTISFQGAIFGSAKARTSRVSDSSRNRQLRSTVSTKTLNRISIFRRPNKRTKPVLGPPRSVFQHHKVLLPSDTVGHAPAELGIWSHGRHKCAVIRRVDTDDDVLRIKMYESYAQVTLFLPRDFHGVVQRTGHWARKTDDRILVRTEKVLRICVAGDDAPLPPSGRATRDSD